MVDEYVRLWTHTCLKNAIPFLYGSAIKLIQRRIPTLWFKQLEIIVLLLQSFCLAYKVKFSLLPERSYYLSCSEAIIPIEITVQ